MSTLSFRRILGNQQITTAIRTKEGMALIAVKYKDALLAKPPEERKEIHKIITDAAMCPKGDSRRPPEEGISKAKEIGVAEANCYLLGHNERIELLGSWPLLNMHELPVGKNGLKMDEGIPFLMNSGLNLEGAFAEYDFFMHARRDPIIFENVFGFDMAGRPLLYSHNWQMGSNHSIVLFEKNLEPRTILESGLPIGCCTPINSRYLFVAQKPAEDAPIWAQPMPTQFILDSESGETKPAHGNEYGFRAIPIGDNTVLLHSNDLFHSGHKLSFVKFEGAGLARTEEELPIFEGCCPDTTLSFDGDSSTIWVLSDKLIGFFEGGKWNISGLDGKRYLNLFILDGNCYLSFSIHEGHSPLESYEGRTLVTATEELKTAIREKTLIVPER